MSTISEILEELPIFPLDTVLFPGAILPLHIFEDRYKQMMHFATENGNLFGLSYRSDAAIARETPPAPGSIGCVARIQAVIPLDEGRMNVISVGLIRYRIAALRQSSPFVLARVETFTDDLEPDEDVRHVFKSIVDQCRRFVAAAQTLDESTVDEDLPEEPESFSLLIASALPVDNDVKQDLLEMTSTKSRLVRLRHYVAHALASYSHRIEVQARARQNGHGKLQNENLD
jgi:Lon protease-like protein